MRFAHPLRLANACLLICLMIQPKWGWVGMSWRESQSSTLLDHLKFHIEFRPIN
jgi:hypothetical protein